MTSKKLKISMGLSLVLELKKYVQIQFKQ